MVLFRVCLLPMTTRHWLSTRIEAGHDWILDDRKVLVSNTMAPEGITCQSTLRRRPNAFNLLHQMKLAEKLGKSSTLEAQHICTIQFHCHSLSYHNRSESLQFAFAQVWNTASELATAYEIGERESGAALNLLQNMDHSVVDALSRLVKTLGCQLLRLILRLIFFLSRELCNELEKVYIQQCHSRGSTQWESSSRMIRSIPATSTVISVLELVLLLLGKMS